MNLVYYTHSISLNILPIRLGENPEANGYQAKNMKIPGDGYSSRTLLELFDIHVSLVSLTYNSRIQ